MMNHQGWEEGNTFNLSSVSYQPTPGSPVHLVVFVPTTTAKSSLLFNHRNKKVVGGKHKVLVHYVEATAPNQKRVLLRNYFE